MSSYFYPEERIAIVGMGALLPDATDVDLFWRNILSKKVSVRPVPDSMMDRELFYRPDAFGKPNKNDMSYTEMAAITDVPDYAALSNSFRIPPAVAEHMDPNQHVMIYCVEQAIKSLANTNINKERTAVITGIGAPGQRYNNVVRRGFFTKLKKYLRSNPELNSVLGSQGMEKFLQEFSEYALEGSVPITEDTAPGILQNIMAARITNLFDFSGPAYTVDAACASTLAATISGVLGLLRREYDVLITGGGDVTLDEGPFMVFSGINALSPDGSYPFDARANGFVMGLGGTALILKRLEDALKDNDRIYALISGFSQGSDGRGRHIAAPDEKGQCRVIKKSFEMAGYHADTVEYIEAHGTGTPVGDVAEVGALKRAFEEMGVGRQGYCGIGSVKSNIGHLRYAAGGVGLIKAALALYNKTLPPNAGINKVNPQLKLEGTPFYILTEKKQWTQVASHPRRANVSAFGFGGANYHIALEEFRPEFIKKNYAFSRTADLSKESQKYVHIGDSIPMEVIFFSGNCLDDIANMCRSFLADSRKYSDFSQAVLHNNSLVIPGGKNRLAVCAKSRAEFDKRWGEFQKHTSKNQLDDLRGLELKGIFFGQGDAVSPDKTAYMFPGQGSQYPNMLKEIYNDYPQIRSLYMQADQIWKSRYNKSPLSVVFGGDEGDLKRQLKETRNTHPAMFLSNIAMFKLLTESGVKADYMVGHSLGEMIALYASGMLDLKTAIELIYARGEAFYSISPEERGAMIAVKAHPSEVKELIQRNNMDITIANVNSKEQIVLGGTLEQVISTERVLKENKIVHKRLDVSHAFHTHLVSRAAKDFYTKIRDMDFNTPNSQVVACHLADFYPQNRKDLECAPSMLKDQIESTVLFQESILKLYKRGVRVFIESGPGSVLTGIVRDILGSNADVKIIESDTRGRSTSETYKRLLGQLFALGMDVCPLPSKKDMGYNGADMQEAYNPHPDVKKKESIVYSGVSVGLPGTFKNVFSEKNFELIFEGKNLIEMLTDEEAQGMADLNITRLIKNEGRATFKELSSVNDVIKLAGKLGKIDMLNDYQVDEKTLKRMTATVCAGVAAGYEALKDAGIPLISEKIKTSKGQCLSERFLLPKDMQEDTGIIFANGFLAVEPFINEVSKYVASKFSGKLRGDLIDFYEKVIERVDNKDIKKLLSDWFSLHYSRLLHSGENSDIYKFNSDFMALISSQANNRLAQFIGAKGPNFHISAACSSTASAVTVAEDLIRGGHAERMIIIGAENVTSKTTLPWAGACFLSMGAATVSSDVFEAAVPFDGRRNGMILGAGALGLVLEKEKDVVKRGMNGICRILGTHSFNTAGSQTGIDKDAFCNQLDRFISKMEDEHRIDRGDMAKKAVYYSHETFSPGEKGCAYTEKNALSKTFGEKYKDVKIINTKAMTGHTMAASIEEAIAAKALQYQRVPPVSNYSNPDPGLEGLNISKGGSYDFEYVLRTVIAYGGQGSFHLLQRLAFGGERIDNPKQYEKWLQTITGSIQTELFNNGKILSIRGLDCQKENGKAESLPAIAQPQKPKELKTICLEEDTGISKGQYVDRDEEKNKAVENMNIYDDDIEDGVLAIYSEVTKYPKEMLELSMEVEADLGIDTVKQATIIAMISDKFGIPQEEGLRLSDFPTIGHMVNMIRERGKPRNQDDTVCIEGVNKEYIEEDDAKEKVLQAISKMTEYPSEMLEMEMELGADLGMDGDMRTGLYKKIGAKFGLQEDRKIITDERATIGDVIDWIKKFDKAGELDCGNTSSQRNGKDGVYDVRQELSLQVPVFVEKDADGVDNIELRAGRTWIIGDNVDATKKVSEYLKKQSLEIREFHFESCLGIDNIEEKVADFIEHEPDLIVDCSHIGTKVEFSEISRKEERDMLFLASEARFVFYKKLSEKIEEPKIKIICLVSMDGCHGYSDGVLGTTEPSYGALSGFYKGLRKEWIKSDIKIVDIGVVGDGILERELSSILTNEIKTSCKNYEIGYSKGKRVVSSVGYLDRSNLKKKINLEGRHYFVTGGGYGITCEIVRKISKRFNARFSIVGRTDPNKAFAMEGCHEAMGSSELKKNIRKGLERIHGRVTPAMVEREFKAFQNSLSIKELISDIESDGNEVVYLNCDVRDYEGLGKALDRAIKNNGPIDILIHGAGIEKSRFLLDKRREEFKEVFSVKAEGICNLYRLVDKDKLKSMIVFSSVSGRFGNEAQVDYCAANNFLSSFMSMVGKKHKNIKPLSISWSGWKDTGIAWENEYIKTHSEKEGLNLIEPHRGAEEFINILNGELESKEVIISKGLSYFSKRDKGLGLTAGELMIDWVTVENGKIERAFRVFSPKRDVILDHHRLGSIPLGPIVAFMEMGAELHSAMYGKRGKYCFKDIRIDRPFKLFRDEAREVSVILKRDDEAQSFNMEAYAYLNHKFGKLGYTFLNSMNVGSSLGVYNHLLELTDIEKGVMEQGYTRDSLQKVSRENESSIQLGTVFIDGKEENNIFRRNDEGAVIFAVMPEEQVTNENYNLDSILINPAFMDSIFQACGIHSQTGNEIYLPWQVGELGVVKTPRQVMRYRVYAKLKDTYGQVREYDAIMLNENNDICYYAKNIRMRAIHS